MVLEEIGNGRKMQGFFLLKTCIGKKRLNILALKLYQLISIISIFLGIILSYLHPGMIMAYNGGTPEWSPVFSGMIKQCFCSIAQWVVQWNRINLSLESHSWCRASKQNIICCQYQYQLSKSVLPSVNLVLSLFYLRDWWLQAFTNTSISLLLQSLVMTLCCESVYITTNLYKIFTDVWCAFVMNFTGIFV